MPNAYDPYREALVIETQTVWPAELAAVPQSPADRKQIEQRLHAEPTQATELEYVRLHAGFIRQITVTTADLSRVRETHQSP